MWCSSLVERRSFSRLGAMLIYVHVPLPLSPVFTSRVDTVTLQLVPLTRVVETGLYFGANFWTPACIRGFTVYRGESYVAYTKDDFACVLAVNIACKTVLLLLLDKLPYNSRGPNDILLACKDTLQSHYSWCNSSLVCCMTGLSVFGNVCDLFTAAKYGQSPSDSSLDGTSSRSTNKICINKTLLK